MANYRITIDFETHDDSVTLSMLTRGLELNVGPIRQAILSDYSDIVGDSAVTYKIVEAKETTLAPETKELLDKDIVVPRFSVSTVNRVHVYDIRTIRQLVRFDRSEIFLEVGKKAFKELDCFLKDHHLHWGMDV